MEGRGWSRIDPTLAVAPDRAILGTDGLASVGGFSARLIDNMPAGFDQFLRSILSYWEFANIQWEFEVMGYSSDEQRDLLSRLGLRTGARMTVLVMLFCGIAGLAVSIGGFHFWRSRMRSRRRDPIKQSYAAFCQSLAAVGLPRHPSLGPVDFARVVGAERPDLHPAAAEIVDLYVRLRYGGDKRAQTARMFIDRVRRFKPRKLD